MNIERAEVLIEALPYIKFFHRKYIVIKYGGSSMIDSALKEAFAKDCALLKYVGIKPIIVHGGGPLISKVMEKMGIPVKFKDGLRITDEESMEVVEMALGKINTEIVSLLNKYDVKAIGLSGCDANMIRVSPIKDFGMVGDVYRIDKDPLETLDDAGFVPVITPIGVDKDGKRYNVNADNVACEVAISIEAEKLIFLTDTKGIYDGKKLLSTIKLDEIEGLIKKKKVRGGMIPKIKACYDAVENEVQKAHIIDGRIKHALLLELFTNAGIGTQVIK